jgi:hypothetical protein
MEKATHARFAPSISVRKQLERAKKYAKNSLTFYEWGIGHNLRENAIMGIDGDFARLNLKLFIIFFLQSLVELEHFTSRRKIYFHRLKAVNRKDEKYGKKMSPVGANSVLELTNKVVACSPLQSQ